jgi:hypothetical protein
MRTVMYAIYKCTDCGAKRVWGYTNEVPEAFLNCAKDGQVKKHVFVKLSCERHLSEKQTFQTTEQQSVVN